MLLIKTVIALCLTWLAQNTNIFVDDFALYDSVFNRQYGKVIEKKFEGYELENDYYLIEFQNGNVHEIESDDLCINDSVTVWFLGNVPVRAVYDKR